MLQNSNFTDLNEKQTKPKHNAQTSKAAQFFMQTSPRGFVFSLDAFIAVFMVTSALFLFLNIAGTNSISSAQSATVIDDTIFALEKTGFLLQTLDSNTLENSASLIRQEIVDYLPNGFDANVSVTSYLIDKEQCALSQTFEACFPDANKLTDSSGGFTEENFISGRKYFIRKERPGDCNVLAEFSAFDPFEGSGIDWIPEKKVEAGALFSEAFFSHGGLHIDFNVTVDPNDSVACDENVTITLTADIDGSIRKPIDLMIVMDRSRPDQNYGGGQPEQCTILNSDKNVMNTFLHNSQWDFSTDRVGIDLYAANADTGNGTLVSSLKTKETAICLSRPDTEDPPNNAIAEGIQIAMDELTKPSQYKPESAKFIVLLSDNLDDSDDTTLATEIARAQDENTVIFTVGVGSVIQGNSAELESIADQTGGEYYFAGDQNSLQTLYALIANRITEFANNSSISVPTITGVDIVDLGGGILSDTNIVFDAGTLDPDNPWTGTYILNFPCNNANVCGIDALTFPGTGTFLTYTDSNGVTHDVDFNASTTLDFKVRDLEVQITGGEVIGTNDISIDVLVENTGELDANSVPLRFYFEDTSTPIVQELVVPNLCTTFEAPGCTNSSKIFSGINFNREGRVYATINDDNSIRECPLGNVDNILCSGGPRTEVFVVDYTVWRN